MRSFISRTVLKRFPGDALFSRRLRMMAAEARVVMVSVGFTALPRLAKHVNRISSVKLGLGWRVPRPGRNTFDESPVAVREASAGGAATSDGAGMAGELSAPGSRGDGSREHALLSPRAQTISREIEVRAFMCSILFSRGVSSVSVLRASETFPITMTDNDPNGLAATRG